MVIFLCTSGRLIIEKIGKIAKEGKKYDGKEGFVVRI